MLARFSWWGLIPILLFAFWLGVRQIDAHPLYGDEIRTVADSRGSRSHPYTIAQIWQNTGQNNPWHAPGYFMLMSVLGPLVSWVPAVLRVFSVFIGVTAIAWTYRLGRDWFSPGIGLMAALLLVTSALYARYLYELRVYSLLALESAVVVWLYLRIINRARKPSPGLWIALFAITVIAFYSHYFAVVPIGAVGLYHLLFVPKNRRWWQVTGVFVAGGLMFLPWIPFMIAGLNKALVEHRSHTGLWQTIVIFLNWFSNGIVVITVALIALVGIALWRRTKRRQVTQLIVISAAALALMLIINAVANIISNNGIRYLMPLWPLYALLLAVGIDQLRRWPAVMGVILLICVGIGLRATLISNFTGNLPGSLALFPIQHVAALLTQDRAQNGDIVVHYLPDSNRVTDNYTYAGIAGLYYDPMHASAVMAMGWTRPRNEDSLVDKIKNKGRLWLAWLPNDRPPSLDVLLDDLAGDFHHCGTLTERSDVMVDLYARNDIACPNNAGLFLDDRAPD